ncbi:LPS export ABC transporter periplasmic protein LptC [Rickettsia sp. MEAM1 (Bemisia tabaci)]|uniref:LPS export ABC transporter periplasmic protein LptC n=1 Tax=unclassified Rickettsia TaxID=114295 RepID=UPI0002D7CA22|nr:MULTISPECIES: LPS export ABC transporter periplasmic protein LptC [unclassified Rickettsia]ASX27512.1 LPS export ABC transporter periplasmic protein LptC [Rickettsia sp. MEAM1 (Bemisia tabaci)]ODA37154.1 LPS export ABC transporter periplasmic protein LptC [Rickettsia sp. wb]ODA38169.1 LPS export ABC transporter periplasmic protein LptC [Rickettsia sp. wq]
MPSSYKRRKKFWKFTYFLIILGILYAGYILVKSSYPTEENNTNIVEKAPEKNLDLKYNIILKDSVFEGVDKNLNSYLVKAEQAIKDSDNKYKLDIINGTYNVNQNQSVTVYAKEGFLNEESHILDLKNDVKFYFEDMIFDTNDARIDLINKSIISNSPATLFHKNSTITSDSFNTQDDNNIIIFKGNVYTTIDLSDY